MSDPDLERRLRSLRSGRAGAVEASHDVDGAGLRRAAAVRSSRGRRTALQALAAAAAVAAIAIAPTLLMDDRPDRAPAGGGPSASTVTPHPTTPRRSHAATTPAPAPVSPGSHIPPAPRTSASSGSLRPSGTRVPPRPTGASSSRPSSSRVAPNPPAARISTTAARPPNTSRPTSTSSR